MRTDIRTGKHDREGKRQRPEHGFAAPLNGKFQNVVNDGYRGRFRPYDARTSIVRSRPDRARLRRFAPVDSTGVRRLAGQFVNFQESIC